MRTYNFSAGPAMLPLPVLEQAQAELLTWQDGMSVMEVTHRSAAFKALAEQTETLLRELLNIPLQYKIFLLPGGATSQFSMVPLNLLPVGKTADYVITGFWSEQAMLEAKRYGMINIATSNQNEIPFDIPAVSSWQLTKDAEYVHYTDNETIDGIEFRATPVISNAPLVSDMSSNLLTKPIDVSQYGIIYACAQKNLGPAGLTIVIIRKDLIGHARADTPGMFNYANHLNAAPPCLNTAPTFIWYMIGLVLAWVKNEGGVTVMAERNQQKADLLYNAIDQSNGFYHSKVCANVRSRVNVPFFLLKPDLEDIFLEEAARVGLMNLAGHRQRGGVRASIYNAMPLAGVKALVAFMQEFERVKG
jgi:phosphoserine aminotransferase